MNTVMTKGIVNTRIAQKMPARLENRSRSSVIIFAPTLIGKSQMDPGPLNRTGIAIRADPTFAIREILAANLQSFQITVKIPASKASTIIETRMNQGSRKNERVMTTFRKNVSSILTIMSF